MAHKGTGLVEKRRDSNPQYLGVKLYGGQYATSGSIIVRQNGTKWQPGFMVGRGRDDTLFARCDGTVVWKGRRVHLDPADESHFRPMHLQPSEA